jgi:hypothetical protein
VVLSHRLNHELRFRTEKNLDALLAGDRAQRGGRNPKIPVAANTPCLAASISRAGAGDYEGITARIREKQKALTR